MGIPKRHQSAAVAAMVLLVLFCRLTFGADIPDYCNKEPILIAWNAFIPYSYQPDQAGRVDGEDIEIVRNIFSSLGCHVVFREILWAKALVEMKRASGVDMMLYASKTKQRQEFARFSLPYRNESVRIAILQENQFKWPLKKLVDINRYQIRLAHNRKTWAGQEFESLLSSSYKHWITHAVSTETGIRMLTTKRIEGMVGDKSTLLLTAKKLGVGHKIMLHPFRLYESKVHFMFSKKTIKPELVEAVNSIIKRSNGEYRN